MIYFIYLFLITTSLIYSLKDDFTSSEVDLSIKRINDVLIIRNEVFGSISNCTIDITSDQNIIYLPKKKFKEISKNQEIKNYITQDKTTIKYIPYNINNFIIDGNGYSRDQKVSIKNLNSYLTIQKNKNQINTLALSHYINPNNSIVHQLYNNHIISKRQFNILYSFPNEGTLSFGKEGSFMRDMKNFIRECKAVEQKYWGCHLSGFFNGNYSIKINRDAIFDNVQKYIIVPLEFFEYLKKNIFEEYLKQKKCKIYENYFLQKIICDKEIKENFEIMHFIFDDNVDLRLYSKDLFDEQNSVIIIYEKQNIEFIFGISFLSNYNIIYNYDEDKIKFFGAGHSYLDKKIDYKDSISLSNENKNEKKLNEGEYFRLKIPIINGNIFFLLKLLLVIIIFGFIVIIKIVCDSKNIKKEKLLIKKYIE